MREEMASKCGEILENGTVWGREAARNHNRTAGGAVSNPLTGTRSLSLWYRMLQMPSTPE